MKTHAPLLVALFLSACGGTVQLGDAETDAALHGIPHCATARIRQVSANGAQAGNPASHAIDGDYATRWSNEGDGAYLTADLGSAEQICGVAIAWYLGNQRTSTFDISVSSDGKSFSHVASGKSSGKSTGLQATALSTVTARYLRVTVHGNSQSDWASITELAVGASSGTTSDAGTPPPPQDAGTPPPPHDAGTPPPPHDAGTPPPPQDAGTTPPPSTGKPDATNTGVPAGTQLTVVNGNVHVTADNTVIDGEDIHGFLTIDASHVTVKNSYVRGGTQASGNGAALVINSGSDILVEDSTITLDKPNVALDGVWGSNFHALRLNISKGVDGMKASGGSTVESCYIHDLSYFASDPNQGGGETHNDTIQILDGANITVKGNNLVAAKSDNSAIQVTQDFGRVTNLLLTGNWADGGGCTFNISHKGESSLSGVTVSGNRFGRNSYYDCPILKSVESTVSLSGNVWDDTGAAVPVQTHD